jgi:hypothetical protein
MRVVDVPLGRLERVARESGSLVYFLSFRGV